MGMEVDLDDAGEEVHDEDDLQLLALPESGIALAARNFLECENQTAKERIISLAVVTCTQGNVYSWAL
jgi:hypothetical protein